MLELYDYNDFVSFLKNGVTGEEINNKILTFKQKGTGIKVPIIAGIYKITNLTNDKIYIGSSLDVRSRWIGHARHLRNKKHTNKYLQRAWDKDGANNFRFELLEDVIGPSVKFVELKIRYIEQFYIDWWVTFNPDNGYNLCIESKGVVFDSAKALKEGKLVVSEEKMNEIIDYLVNTDIPLVDVAEKTGVKNSLIKDIYQKRAYRTVVQDYEFKERYNASKKRFELKDRYWEELLQLEEQGKTKEEIAEILNINIRDLNYLFNTRTNKNEMAIYQFDLEGNFVNKFYYSKTCAKELEINYEGLMTGLRRNDKIVYEEKGFVVSRNPKIEMSLLEKAVGHFVKKNKRMLFIAEYNRDDEIINVYHGISEINGLNMGKIQHRLKYPERFLHEEFYFKKNDDIKESELMKYINKKENSPQQEG